MAAQAYIVTDIGYGDTGKGTTVDFLARTAKSTLVVRHNGGPQAAHNVVTPDGQHHTFSQFGSGSFVPGVRTHLSRFMLVDPTSMLYEADHLIACGVTDIWQRTSIDPECVIITPWQRSANHLRELARGKGVHGSCGVGVGETMADTIAHPQLAIRVRDLDNPDTLRAKLHCMRTYKFEQLRSELKVPVSPHAEVAWASFSNEDLLDGLLTDYSVWLQQVTILDGDGFKQLAECFETIVFEGAQGVLLDEWYGFHPHTTWSTTTHANALQLLQELCFSGEVTRFGVLRAYMTRHGNGPFVTESSEMTQSVPDMHNGLGTWQGSFRVGHLDLVAHRYALEVCGGADKLVVTGLDRLEKREKWLYCTSYRFDGNPALVTDLFDFNEAGEIIRIIPGNIDQLDRQERITEALQSCSPVYQEASASLGMPDTQAWRLDAFLWTIEEQLATPVTITSFGPTAADKHALVAC